MARVICLLPLPFVLLACPRNGPAVNIDDSGPLTTITYEGEFYLCDPAPEAGASVDVPVQWGEDGGPDVSVTVGWADADDAPTHDPVYAATDEGPMIFGGEAMITLPPGFSFSKLSIPIDDSCGEEGCIVLEGYRAGKVVESAASDAGAGPETLLIVDEEADVASRGMTFGGVGTVSGYVWRNDTPAEVTVTKIE